MPFLRRNFWTDVGFSWQPLLNACVYIFTFIKLLHELFENFNL
jgi:hypothetical protein